MFAHAVCHHSLTLDTVRAGDANARKYPNYDDFPTFIQRFNLTIDVWSGEFEDDFPMTLARE